MRCIWPVSQNPNTSARLRGGWGLMMLQTASQDAARLAGAFRALDQLKFCLQHVFVRKCAVSGLFPKIQIRPHD